MSHRRPSSSSYNSPHHHPTSGAPLSSSALYPGRTRSSTTNSRPPLARSRSSAISSPTLKSPLATIRDRSASLYYSQRSPETRDGYLSKNPTTTGNATNTDSSDGSASPAGAQPPPVRGTVRRGQPVVRKVVGPVARVQSQVGSFEEANRGKGDERGGSEVVGRPDSGYGGRGVEGEREYTLGAQWEGTPTWMPPRSREGSQLQEARDGREGVQSRVGKGVRRMKGKADLGRAASDGRRLGLVEVDWEESEKRRGRWWCG